MAYGQLPMPDLGLMIQGGARYAEMQRQAEAFKLQKEDRAFARQQEEKKLEFARRSRELAAVRLNEKDPEKKALAFANLAAHSPEDAMKVQEYETKQLGAESDLQTEQLAQQDAQFKLQNKQQLDQAVQLKQGIEAFKEAPNEFNLGFQAKRLAAQGAPPEIVQSFTESLRTPGGASEFSSVVDDTIARLSAPPKAAAPFRPVGTALTQAQMVQTILARENREDKTGNMFGAQGPDYASATYPKEWALAGAELEKANAAGKSTTLKVDMGPGPGDKPGTVVPQKTVLAGLENKILMYNDVLMKADEQVKAIGGNEADQYFGFEGDVKEAGSKLVSYFMGSATPDVVQKWTEGKQAIRSFGTMMTYDFLVALSGKAVTDAERRTIIKAVGDPDSMTLFEYRSAMKTMKKLSSMAIESARLTRRFGLDVMTMEERTAADDEVATFGAKLSAGGYKSQDEVMSDLSKLKRKHNVYSALKLYEDNTGRGDWLRAAKPEEGSSESLKDPTGAARTPQKGQKALVKGIPATFDGKNWVED